MKSSMAAGDWPLTTVHPPSKQKTQLFGHTVKHAVTLTHTQSSLRVLNCYLLQLPEPVEFNQLWRCGHTARLHPRLDPELEAEARDA